MKQKVVIALNTAWNIVNFRSGLVKALVAEGYEVVAVAPADNYVNRLEELGCQYRPIEMDNKGTNPGRDLFLFLKYLKIVWEEKPCIYLGFTVKPNIYGSLAAQCLGIPVINNVAGLGTVFGKKSLLSWIVRRLYWLAFFRSKKVFFQNTEDRQLFISERLVPASVTDLLPGSGIDLLMFRAIPLPTNPTIRFLLIARMLWSKGVGEFVEAAKILKNRGLNAEFCLLGFVDVQNPAAISREQIEDWVAEGAVSFLGSSDNVFGEISKADCVVLPSFYREGTPRSLLEAAAMARPIVTTNSVGCREVVDDGVNGYLCRPKDALDLAEKMAKVASLSPVERSVMGKRSREKAELMFDERIVIGKYIEAIASNKLVEVPVGGH